MKELEHILISVDLFQGSDLWRSEGRIGSLDQRSKIGTWDFGRIDERRIDLESELLE
jgi:hypothetical protein